MVNDLIVDCCHLCAVKHQSTLPSTHPLSFISTQDLFISTESSKKNPFPFWFVCFYYFSQLSSPPVSWQPAPPTVLATPLHSSQMVLGGADRMGDNNQNNWATCESTTTKDASGFFQIGVVVKRVVCSQLWDNGAWSMGLIDGYFARWVLCLISITQEWAEQNFRGFF